MTEEISEWDKACKAVKRRLGVDVLIPELQCMKTEGDKIQERNIYLEGLTDSNAKLLSKTLKEAQKLEEILLKLKNGTPVYRILEEYRGL